MNAKITKDNRKRTGWVRGVAGKHDELRWVAKVYEQGSVHGIGEGRVSKLAIAVNREPTLANAVFNYDRGLDTYNIAQNAVDAVLALFPTPVCPKCGSIAIEGTDYPAGTFVCAECGHRFEEPEERTDSIGFGPDGSAE